MLRILMGEAKTGKSFRVYDDIISQIKLGQANRCMLIVPEQFTLEAEKLLLEQGDLPGVLGLEILSLKRLAHFVFDQLGKPDETEITRLGQMMLLKEVFETQKNHLVFYKRAFDKKGMLDKCYDLIEELKQNRIGPDQLQESLDQIGDKPILKSKLMDLSLIFKAYEAAKDQKYFDGLDVYDALIEKLPHAEYLRHKHIWIDGFDSFSVQELTIIEILCQLSSHVTMTLTTRDDGASSERFAHTINVLDRLKRFEGVELTYETFEKSYMSHDLRHLSLNAMTYPIVPWRGKTEGITLFEAQSRLSEVDWTVRQILKLMREEKASWRDFSILTNGLDSYRMLLIRAFDRQNIPYFIDEKRPILNHPVVHFLTNLSEVIQRHFRPESVIKLLKTGFFDVDMERLGQFENHMMEKGLFGSKFLKAFESDWLTEEELSDLEALRNQLVQPLLAYKEAIQKASTVEEQLKCIYDVMLSFEIPAKIDVEVKRFAQEGNFEQSQLYAQIWNAVIDVFDQLSSLLGKTQMSVTALWDRILVGLEQSEIGLLPLTPQHVFVGSIDRSRTHPVKYTFILGINDGILPESGSDQQLLQEPEKQVINNLGLRWLSDQNMFLQKESFNIYQALTRPSEKLFLSYAFSDQKGSALRPSYLIPKFKKILPDMVVVEEGIGHLKHFDHITTPVGTLVTLAAQMRLHLDGQEIDPVWFHVFEWYKDHMPDFANKLKQASKHHYHVERLDEAEIKDLYELPLKSSVSGLEQHIQCPFKYFVNQGLRPRTVKPYEIRYPDVGILFHTTLERFGKLMIERDLAWEKLSKEACEHLIEEIVGGIVSGDIYQSKFQYKALVRKLSRVAKRAIWTLTQHLQSGRFTPAAFELAFTDKGAGVPPIFVKLESGQTLMLRGVVDRIDLLTQGDDTYVKIIDYKSGNTSLSLQEVYNGLQMQLCVYMYACLLNPSYFRASHLKPAGLYYYKIDDPLLETTEVAFEKVEAQILNALKLDGLTLEDDQIIEALDFGFVETSSSSIIQVKKKKDGTFAKESKVLNDQQFTALIDHVMTKVKAVGDDILEGNIDISPCRTTRGLVCQYCQYSSICQFDDKRDFQAVRNMPKLKDDDVLDRLLNDSKKEEI